MAPADPTRNRDRPPPPTQAQPSSSKGRLALLIGSSAALIVTPLVATWEGKRNDPYYDIAGILTVCYGDTANIERGRSYTDAECSARLENQLIEHARPVLRCTPGLRQHPPALAAAISLTYNIGGPAYCGSTVARRFNAGDISGACDAFMMWNKARVNGRLQQVRGLTRRRAAERDMCRRALTAGQPAPVTIASLAGSKPPLPYAVTVTGTWR